MPDRAAPVMPPVLDLVVCKKSREVACADAGAGHDDVCADADAVAVAGAGHDTVAAAAAGVARLDTAAAEVGEQSLG